MSLQELKEQAFQLPESDRTLISLAMFDANPLILMADEV